MCSRVPFRARTRSDKDVKMVQIDAVKLISKATARPPPGPRIMRVQVQHVPAA